MNPLLVAFMFAAAVCVADETCEKGEKVKITNSLTMVCKKTGWTPTEKKGRAKPGAPPCEDSIGEGQCQADRGHCLQYTDKGQEMDRTCPGTCDSCDGCRCQDNSQWHMYCPYWAQYCSSPGVLGTWMSDNCKKTCNKCRCPCCNYKGKSHEKGEKIPLPEKCGELVCEEALQADASPLLPGAVLHNISHPEELTLSFRSLFPGSDCCIVNGSASGMVEEGWTGTVTHKGSLLPAACCHGVLCTHFKDANLTNSKTTSTTTSTSTTTTTSSTTTTTTTTTLTSTTPAGSGFHVVFQKYGEFTLEKDTSIGTLPYMGTQYRITFDMFISAYVKNTQSILHFSIGENDCLGCRTPALWVLSDETIYIGSAINGNQNLRTIHNGIPARKWHKVEISQMLSGNKIMFSFKVNGVDFWTIANTQPEKFKDVLIYASNPWHDPLDAKIRALTVETMND